MAVRDSAAGMDGRLDPGRAGSDFSIGAVALTVADLARAREFYTGALGMTVLGRTAGGALQLGGADGTVLLELSGDPAAPPRDPGATGLYHFAVLVPSRAELARSLLRLALARWPLSGASDHWVSEALYLSDPEGNGIEIYRDRPRTEWPTGPDGGLEMSTEPLDLDGLLAELGELTELGGADLRELAGGGLAAGTTVGHVHLQVASLPEAEAFYAGVLGFDVTVRGYPGALFVSAGGYHHHVGLNTWHSRSAAAPAAGTAGLRWYELRVGSAAGLQAALTRAAGAGLAVEQLDAGALVRDPSGNGVLLRR